jgi:glycosyltransferase involved in cell wall biosynthesis
MSNPEFTVIIPVRNGENYIDAAISSVLSQSYPHFRILVLENASTDKTVEIVNELGDKRISIIPASVPLDIESNWGRILDLELGEYLTILGHDDIFYPEFLQEIVSLIAQEPNASLYTTHFHIIDSDGKVIRPCKSVPYKETGEAFMNARQHFHRDNFGTGYVMCSADFKRVGGFLPFAKLYFSDDFAFYRLADISGKICSPKFLFGYRYHLKSESYMSGMETLTQASQQFITALEQTPYAKNPANMVLARDYINKTFTRRYIRILVNLLYSGDTSKLHDYYAAHKAFLKQFPVSTFSIYNIMAKGIEFLTRLPLSWIRKPMSKVLYDLVKITRGMKN